MAPDWTYTLIGDAGGSEFVDAHFGADRPDIVATYRALGNGTALFPNSNHHNNNHKKNLALKSDFLRYLLLFVRGGVYSDLDTRPLAPLGEWVEVRAAPVRLVVAVEYDSPVLGPTEAYPVQFGQWTIAAAAGHPVLACMIERALAGLRDLGLLAGDDDSSSSPSPSAPPATPAQAQAGENAVYNATGPIGWTECVMDGIRRTLEHPERFRHANLSGIAGPRYFGDIVVLPDGAFAAALPPGSPEPGNGDRVGLVSHAFRGVWKHP
ncbi:nucleotide-diphospho-sugar transferase [Biscogniauxia mediterranea]|nr:nucleotide-diphospho-sugar transferase [Biscogniauxia mediterranea]